MLVPSKPSQIGASTQVKLPMTSYKVMPEAILGEQPKVSHWLDPEPNLVVQAFTFN